MKTPRHVAALALLLPLLLAAGPFHIELTASFPEADQELDTAPSEIWLEFSVVPDMEQTSFSVRGPEGRVALEEIEIGEDASVLTAAVTGTMAAGEYTVSWVGAAPDDHAERGRFSFSVTAR